MDGRHAVHLSKFLSLVLRHRPGAAGVSLDREGWVDVDELLSGARRHGVAITQDDLRHIVATDDKQRLAFSEDGRRIRANQGHSRPVDLGLLPTTPPVVLFHGTVERAVEPILATGLERRARQYVHLSPDVETARKVGARRGQPVILRIDAAAMAAAGHAFYLSRNGVWLVEAVPPAYISR
jgi:putative RNA 2'-phosphotransferase